VRVFDVKVKGADGVQLYVTSVKIQRQVISSYDRIMFISGRQSISNVTIITFWRLQNAESLPVLQRFDINILLEIGLTTVTLL
jgi:hypothetical protein